MVKCTSYQDISKEFMNHWHMHYPFGMKQKNSRSQKTIAEIQNVVYSWIFTNPEFDKGQHVIFVHTVYNNFDKSDNT